MKTKKFYHFLFLLLFLCAVQPAQLSAGSLAGKTIRVGVYVEPPFTVVDSYGVYSGLTIDLWEDVAKRLNVLTEYVCYDTIHTLLDAATRGDIDIVALNIANSYERAKFLRYSFPWLEAGFQIMVVSNDKSSFFEELIRLQHLYVYAILIAIFFAMSLLIMYTRRRWDPSFTHDWKLGFTECLLDAFSSIKYGYLNQAYLGWIGSLLSVIWMIFGVGVIAYVTSSITSSMTTSALRATETISIVDILDKRIGILSDEISEEYLQSLGLKVVPFDHIEDLSKALLDNNIDVVVGSEITLAYYIQTHPGLPLALAGESFQNIKFSFVSGLEKQELMDRVSDELIWLYETGQIDSLIDRYFDEDI